jgi:hypothetical protein
MQEKETYKFNLTEIPRSFRLAFLNDDLDTNTKDNQTGNNVTIGFKTPSGGGFPALAEQKDASPSWSRAYRKNSTSTVEALFNSMYDFFTSFFGGGPNLLGNRTGMLKLNGDFIGVTKIFMLGENKRIPELNDEVVNALNIYEIYHRKSMINGIWGLWTIVEGVSEQPICSGLNGSAEFIVNQIRLNNVVYDFNGRIAVLESMEFSNDTRLYTFRYRVQGWINPIQEQNTLIQAPSVIELISEDE